MKTKNRKPDYRVMARTDDEQNDGEIGSAWLNDGGNIIIILKPFVVLQSQRQLHIMLFPREYKETQ